MNLPIKIVEAELSRNKKRRIYSYQLHGESSNVYELFGDYLYNSNERGKFIKLLEELEIKLNEQGFGSSFEHIFNLQNSSMCEYGYVAGYGSIRLYGLWFSDSIILLGRGGLKPSNIRRRKDAPPCDDHAKEIENIGTIINYRIKQNKVTIDCNNKFRGNLIINEKKWKGFTNESD